MKKIADWIDKNYYILLPFLLFFIYVISVWNKNLPIGGDNIIPLKPIDNIEKSIYIWESWNQGVSQWRYTYFFWQLPFFLLTIIGVPLYIAVKTILTSYLVIAFVFTCLFFRTLFENSKYDRLDLGIFCALIFTLNADMLLILPTTAFLSALPLCSYLFIKYFDTGKFRYAIFFSTTISYAYFGHLPQGKYFLILLGVLFFVLLFYMEIRKISFWKILSKFLKIFVVTFLLNAFILLPFIFEAFKPGGTFSFYTKNVTVYNGEADLNTATLFNISRFFTSSLVDPGSSFGEFFRNSFFIVWSSILWLMVFFSVFFVKTGKEKKVIFFLFLGIIPFIFLAKGANPPFGEIYKFLLFHLPIFKLFRTTANTIMGASLFFSILATISFYYIAKGRKNIFTIFVLIHVFVFSPVYLGYRFITFEEKGVIKKGYEIPKEYIEMGDRLDKIKDDVKILSLPLDDGYSYKDWPYMGQPIMAYLTKKPFIHGQVAGYPGFTDNLILQRMTAQEACYWTAINNVGFILQEKDSRIGDYSIGKFNFSGFPVLENSYFRLEKVNPECFLPHIYAATEVFSFKGQKNNVPDVSRFIKNKRDVVVAEFENSNISQIIEAYPEEINSLSDNAVTKKVFSDLSAMPPLNFWTYSVNAPAEGNFQMIVDDMGFIKKETIALKKGNNAVKIPISRPKNLIDNNLLDLFINDKKAETFKQILKDWQGDNLYLLSLKYRADIASSLMLTLDEITKHFAGRLPSYELNAVILSQELNHEYAGIYQYQAILKTDINAQTGTVTLRKLFGDITVESFKIEKVTPPKVFFVVLKGERRTIPQASFRKINPTKYIVDVKGAAESYYLVFSESFSPDWKAHVQQKPIAESQHLVVNGFANGWEIGPKDSKGKTDYIIIVEYWPQRLFYIGAIISGLTGILYIILQIMQKVKKNHP